MYSQYQQIIFTCGDHGNAQVSSLFLCNVLIAWVYRWLPVLLMVTMDTHLMYSKLVLVV